MQQDQISAVPSTLYDVVEDMVDFFDVVDNPFESVDSSRSGLEDEEMALLLGDDDTIPIATQMKRNFLALLPPQLTSLQMRKWLCYCELFQKDHCHSQTPELLPDDEQVI